MNTVLFNKIVNLMKDSITSSPHENPEERINHVFDELRKYCSNTNLMGGYRLIRLLECEFLSLFSHSDKNLPPLCLKISNMLKVEKEILIYKIKHPELIKKDDTTIGPLFI